MALVGADGCEGAFGFGVDVFAKQFLPGVWRGIGIHLKLPGAENLKRGVEASY